MDTQQQTLAIIGGGAAGLAAAIAAARYAQACALPLSVEIFERDERIGRSILATGNGRCNFSNAQLNFDFYRNAAFVQKLDQELQQSFCNTHSGGISDVNLDVSLDAVHEFFAGLGLAWRQEPDGRQYPQANKASVVLDVLRAEIEQRGVCEHCNCELVSVKAPRKDTDSYVLRFADGTFKHANAVIFATGASAVRLKNPPHKASKDLGEAHSVDFFDTKTLRVEPFSPVLGPLSLNAYSRVFTRELDNIRVRVQLDLLRKHQGEPLVASEVGELLFRKYGVSGICVFNLSRFARPQDILRINFLYEQGVSSVNDAFAYLQNRYKLQCANLLAEPTCFDLLRGLLLPRLSEALLKTASLKPSQVANSSVREKLAHLLVNFTLEIEGIADPSLCQVSRGGIAVDEIDPLSMSLRALPGLYACGEVVDVDGPCGGYNLNWAWSSGLVAGANAAKFLQESE